MELEVVAGLDAAVVVDVVVAVVGFITAELGVVGAFGAEGVWASATEAVTARAINGISKVLGFMVARLC